MTLDTFRVVVLIIFAVTTIFTDWRHKKIYNFTTYPVIVLGLLLSVLDGVPGELFRSGLADHVVATAGAFAFLYPLYVVGGMKPGDPKFLMAIGALLGTSFLWTTFVGGALIGGALAIGFLLIALVHGRGLRAGLMTNMPYGLAFASGSLVALAFFH